MDHLVPNLPEADILYIASCLYLYIMDMDYLALE